MCRAVTTYDEMGLFRENVDEAGLTWAGEPTVERRSVVIDGDRRVSALVWGSARPDIVLLHGGAQNAHTWDTVALALGRPLVAIDLPGHGHSDWRDDHNYWPAIIAEDVAAAVRVLAPDASMLVGMSLGGLTAWSLAAEHPELVRRLVIVDVTPGTDEAKAEPIRAFVSGPERFDSFDEILERTVQYNPTRSVSSLRRGVLHNAKELPDGGWTWRYDPMRNWSTEQSMPDFASLWAAVDAVDAPLLLVRGGTSQVVGDEDIEELLRRRPATTVVTVDGAGHSVQGDKPVELARILEDFLTS
jgi:pimeloyl-ACP methyl ester carboxylesterase